MEAFKNTFKLKNTSRQYKLYTFGKMCVNASILFKNMYKTKHVNFSAYFIVSWKMGSRPGSPFGLEDKASLNLMDV